MFGFDVFVFCVFLSQYGGAQRVDRFGHRGSGARGFGRGSGRDSSHGFSRGLERGGKVRIVFVSMENLKI